LALAGCGSSGGSGSTTSSSTAAKAAAGSAHVTTITGFKATGSKSPATATLTALPKAQKGVGAQIQGVAGQPLSQQITTIDGDINSFWGGLFNKAGLQWPAMRQSLISSGTASAPNCQGDTTIAATDPWRLCDSPTGGTFYFPLTWVGQNVATDQGGVNLLLGIAELWSNHVENLLGVTQAAENGQIQPAGYAEINVCLTGVYAYSVNQRQLFQAGDQQTFQNWYQRMSPEFTDVSANDVSTQQLQQAFAAGLKSGNPSTCLPSKGGGGGGGTTSQTGTQTAPQTGTQTAPQTSTQPPTTQTQPSGGGTGTIPLGGLSHSGG
jgi:predicted metalloprotease